MKRKIENLFKSVSTRVILIIFALILPLNVVVLIYMNNTMKTVIGQAEQSGSKMADFYIKELETRMKNSRTLLTYFMTKDEDCIRLNSRNQGGFEYEESKMKFNYKLRSMASMSDGADGYFYYFRERKDSVIYGNADGGSQMVNQIKSVLTNYSAEENPSGWHIYQRNEKNYLFFIIPDKKVVYGAVIRLDPFVDKVMKSMEYEDVKVEFIEQPGESAYAPSKRHLLIKSQLKDFSLNIQLSKDEVLERISFAQKVLNVMALIYILLIPFLFVVLRRILIQPLQKVNYAHQQIREGDSQFHIKDQTSITEYNELYASFNQMVDNLNRLKIESYEKEIAKQKMELRNLQLQIRPHFLLNTFNLIFTLSKRHENEMIQETVIYLSEYFRYIFRSQKELELFSNEINLIKGYVKMASIRYLGMIEGEYEFAPEIDFVRLPPLLLHNFVENAVKYGVQPDTVLHIRVTGEYKDKRVVFTIQDNGKGMSSEMLLRNQQLFRGEIKLENEVEHLGLYNSLRRLKYFYGEEAKIEATSERGVKTCFVVSFPYDVEVEE